MQAYIKNLPTYEELLKGETIRAADCTPIWTRQADGNWPAKMFTFGSQYWGSYERSWKREVNWYERTKREAIPRNSRFGEFPVPADLSLGNCTLVLSNKRPHKQVMSKPIRVKPDTGYRLSFYVRMSGGNEYFRGPQVFDGAYDPESVPIGEDLYGNPKVLNALPATSWWGAGRARDFWAKMEIPFRTGRNCKSIIIRLPHQHHEEAERRKKKNESGRAGNHRMWYDDLRLVEDASVQGIGPTDE